MEEEDFPNFSLEFNFPSIQETAKKPKEQQQQACLWKKDFKVLNLLVQITSVLQLLHFHFVISLIFVTNSVQK